jgi:ribonuclease HII
VVGPVKLPPDSKPDFSLETAALGEADNLFANSKRIVIGVDEAGRGPWAGPVTAAAAWLNPDCLDAIPMGLNDSKKLSAQKRQLLFNDLSALPPTVFAAQVASRNAQDIDQSGILPATFTAMEDAVIGLLQHWAEDQLNFKEYTLHVLVDGHLKPPFPRLGQYIAHPPVVTPVIKGDGRSLSIAAASIMAKETRDQIMTRLDQDHPGYGWADNKGYGTSAHQAALAKQGITPHHRQSFKPIAAVMAKTLPQDKGLD